MSRKVWKISAAGSLSRLNLEIELEPDLQPEYVRVKVIAVGLNFADIFACLGLYSATPEGAFIPGLEFSGIVQEAAGGFQVGDRVYGMTRFGAYVSSITCHKDYLRKIPDEWSFEEAAAFPVQALTAWYGLADLGSIFRRKKPVVLLHSAAGGVGLNSFPILEQAGASIIATVGSEDKKKYLIETKNLNDRQVIVRNPKSFAADLQNALLYVESDGCDIVFDSVAGPYFRAGFESLKPAGSLILFGAADFMPEGKRPNYLKLALKYFQRPRIDPLKMISQNRNLMAFNLIWLFEVDYLSTVFDEMMKISWKPPVIDTVFPFDEAVEAMRYFQSGVTKGKVLLSLSSEDALKIKN